MRKRYKLDYIVYDIYLNFDNIYHYKKFAMKRMLRLWGSCKVFNNNKMIKQYETIKIC
jgi:hypothetical protein